MVQFSTGRTTHLGVQSAWAYIFQKNEVSIRKMTDGQIAAWMMKEFPDRNTTFFKDLSRKELWRVQQARSRYNRGALTQGKIPDVKSHRYNDQGEPCDPIYSGKAGVKLSRAS